ncbi:type IV secretory system conjugative DNA transfer family protein [Rhodophyticola porphyridii]|uniref:DUF87 domain-containing protein n=1 Tax=Rhodophyticola porphyridii TaxID=1852017 RepID=A0A3L9YKG1_9RHOB|nr:DUF87 domain-containing protein [Rhodophyticola porphyridii]RMA43300.1 DUF87 domain-containing protein [Rhodophyticola porphyridii]
MRQPASITQLGIAYHRYGDRAFGITQSDRLSHLYVIGQTGTGKSTLLGQMARQDAAQGIGFCLLDPHGDLASELATALPDALYWDVADPASPYGYNPLTRTSPALRPLVASGLIEALKAQWADAWGVRMEHLLRYAILALLDTPTPDLTQIMPLYLNKDFRATVLPQVRDEQVRAFWIEEFGRMNYKTAIDGVAPIANKLGAFLAHPVVRRALCEPVEPLRFRRAMDTGQGVIVNLGKGRLGGDLANVIGGMLVSSLMHAAFTRSTVAHGDRHPFNLYVDEFHAFTSESFAHLLAETRKYGLSATLAQQHTAQTNPGVLASILGNVGTVMAFRLGALDAPLLASQLGDVSPETLTTQPNHQAYVRLLHQGHPSRAFSMRTVL